MAKRVIGLVGNIGAGKSTLGNFIMSKRGKEILAEYIPDHNIRYFKEKVDEAAKELFYGERRVYTDELELIQARLRSLRHTLAAKHNGIVLFDRTLIEGSETFRRNSFEDGYMTHHANTEYDQIIRNTTDRLGRDTERITMWLETILVYIKVKDPFILQSRQIARADPKESIIPVEYFESLNKIYNKFIEAAKEIYGKWGLRSPRIVILDGSVDINEHPEILEEHTRKIAMEIKKEMDGVV